MKTDPLTGARGTVRPIHLRCEHLIHPLGIDVRRPRLSWTLEWNSPELSPEGATSHSPGQASAPPWVIEKGTPALNGQHPQTSITSCHSTLGCAGAPRKNIRQSSYQIVVTHESGAVAWDSGKVDSDTSILVEYAGEPLASALRHHWKVRVWDETGAASDWTDYRKRVQYQAIDVTQMLQEGENALSATLGSGWYAGRLGLSVWSSGGELRGFYGTQLRLIAQLDIKLEDGQRQSVISDESWRGSADGPIRSADILDGEVYDARREMLGWDLPGFDDSAWQAVSTSPGPRLFAQQNEPIRITQRLKPVAVTKPTPGVAVFDLGQNMVGWCRLNVRGREAGTDIRLRHAEALNPDGTLYRENLRHPPFGLLGAPQEDHYICRGGGDENFEPHFTYHGFRYVEVTGLGYRPSLNDLEGCVLHSGAANTGKFECSSPLLNKIMTAIQWTQRGNLHGIPTDCPQRDERLGWTGDIQVFSQTAIFNMDMAAFFTKWLRDVRDAQSDEGGFPDFAPHPFDCNTRANGNPGWGDAGVIVPWRAYVNYGDLRLLEENFHSGKRWIEFILLHNPSLIWRNFPGTEWVYGDWLNGDTFVGLPDWPQTGGEVPKDLYASAFFAYSTELIARSAEVLGHKSDGLRYTELARDIRAAFNREFVSSEGRVKGDTQAGYALALHFDLLPETLRPLAAQHMVRALNAYQGRLSTGIQSTVRMMLELSRYGYHEEAYALMTSRTIPSWGYMVEHGGTTIWERWDGWVEGRGFQNAGMNSFNHYAIGAVGEWMWKVIIGLNPDEHQPGWKHFIVRPVPGGGLTSARGTYHSIRGPVTVEWHLVDGTFQLDVTVPGNSSATVYLPSDGSQPHAVGSGTHHFESLTA